ncbi:MAG: cation diffusion facilitator family transporter [Casimicrobiaceae bacterium]
MTTGHSDDAFHAHTTLSGQSPDATHPGTAARDGRGDHATPGEDAGGHGHPHVHAHDGSTVRALAWALALTGVFALIEAIGGWLAGSLALLSDAGHMVTDAAALGLALFAQWVARRPPSARASYGYARAEVLAAFVNAIALLLLVAFIAFEAVRRMLVPEPVAGGTVMVIAAAGLFINLVTAWILSRASRSQGTQSVLLHVLSDALGSIAALVAGAVITTTGWTPIDPLLSLVTALLILRSTWRLLGQTTRVLMEGVPAHLDYDEIGHALLEIDGVSGVHDLHVWYMDADEAALSAHVAIDSGSRWPAILDEARRMLDSRFHIDHVTLQPSWPLQPVFGDRRVIPIRSSARGGSARTAGDRRRT